MEFRFSYIFPAFEFGGLFSMPCNFAVLIDFLLFIIDFHGFCNGIIYKEVFNIFYIHPFSI